MTSNVDAERKAVPFVPQVLQVVQEVPKRRFLIVTLPELGHLNPVLYIGAELARRGHDVTLASCAFAEEKVGKRCREMGVDFLALAPEVVSSDVPGSKEAELKDASPALLYIHYNEAMKEPLQAVACSLRPHLILADFTTVCAFSVGDACGVPVALNYADPTTVSLFGLSPNPLMRIIGSILIPPILNMPFRIGPLVMRFFWSLIEALYTRACIVDSYWGVTPLMLVPPNVVFTGPMGPRTKEVLQETSLAELNEWIRWVRQKGLRVVYVTFGSMQVLTPAQVQAIYHGLVDLPGVAVAWSLKEKVQEHLPGRPEHFFIHNWFPQAEVLKLPEVVAVVTHCGWGGLMEICLAGKPLVGVPFHGDQPTNAETAKRQRFAEVVPAKRLSASALKGAMNKVLTERRYTENAQKVQASLLTSGGAQQASQHLELFATHDCRHLLRPAPSLGRELAKVVAAGLLVTAVCVAASGCVRGFLK